MRIKIFLQKNSLVIIGHILYKTVSVLKPHRFLAEHLVRDPPTHAFPKDQGHKKATSFHG